MISRPTSQSDRYFKFLVIPTSSCCYFVVAHEQRKKTAAIVARGPSPGYTSVGDGRQILGGEDAAAALCR